MARIRTIKPELPSDAALARCSRDARYCFILLITQADDYGLIPASARQLLGTLFPLEEEVTAAMVGGWIGELVAAGLCRWRWTRDGAPVVELVNWDKHQRIDNRRKPVLKEQLDETRAGTPGFAQVSAESRGGLAASRGESPLEPPTSDRGPWTGEEDRGDRPIVDDPPFSTSGNGVVALLWQRVATEPDRMALEQFFAALPRGVDPGAWASAMLGYLDGVGMAGGRAASPAALCLACREFLQLPATERTWSPAHFRGFVGRAARPPSPRAHRGRRSVEDATIANLQALDLSDLSGEAA